MDNKIVGLVGAISGLASLDAAQAATVAGPNATEVLGARSYAELLDPIPNALALLREVEAADPAPAGSGADPSVGADPNMKVAAHHHHHHHHRYRHHHHHHHHRWWYHHHHHHHRYRHHHHHHHHRG
jgi:hypothetical protein